MQVPSFDSVKDIICKQFLAQEKKELKLSSVLYGPSSLVDSLGLVTLTVAIEVEIEKQFGKKISLGDNIGINFTKDTIEEITHKVINAFLEKPMKKLIIVDLDNTLWEGVVGDDGWENLVVNDNQKQLQCDLLELTTKGILLAISSKNTEHIALEAIDMHPDMILRTKDFVEWSINWDEKFLGIVEMVKRLNLGLESVVFIDDSPLEREKVKRNLPEVSVSEKLDKNLFNLSNLTKEDLERLSSYKTEKTRQDLKQQYADFNDWVSNLNLAVNIRPMMQSDMQRVVQLYNKTNQMNLSTRRLQQEDIERMTSPYSSAERIRLWVIEVNDKFGSYGLTGLVCFSISTQGIDVVDFILSCRVMGRNVEQTIINHLVNLAKQNHMSYVRFHYIRTDKNSPCFKLLSELSGVGILEIDNKVTFTLEV